MTPIRYLLFILASVVAENSALEEINTAIPLKAAKDNPVLLKILQTVDAATSNEKLFDVTLKILKSLCLCMRDTLRTKQLESYQFSQEMKSLQTGDDVRYANKKVLDLYQRIYNKTCFDLREELAMKVNKSGDVTPEEEKDFMEQSSCGKKAIEENTEDYQMLTRQVTQVPESETSLKKILHTTFVLTRSYHQFHMRKFNLFKNPQKSTENSAKHSIIVILTYYPHHNGTYQNDNSSEVNIAELNTTLYTNSPIDIDVIDTRYGRKANSIDEDFIPKPATNCSLKSIYNFLLQSEQANKTKVFKMLRKKGTIKVYIDIPTQIDHLDYSKVCCGNETDIPMCKINFSAESFDTHEITTYLPEFKKRKKLHGDYKDTIFKIKTLVKLYDRKLNRNKLHQLNLKAVKNNFNKIVASVGKKIKAEEINKDDKLNLENDKYLQAHVVQSAAVKNYSTTEKYILLNNTSSDESGMNTILENTNSGETKEVIHTTLNNYQNRSVTRNENGQATNIIKIMNFTKSTILTEILTKSTKPVVNGSEESDTKNTYKKYKTSTIFQSYQKLQNSTDENHLTSPIRHSYSEEAQDIFATLKKKESDVIEKKTKVLENKINVAPEIFSKNTTDDSYGPLTTVYTAGDKRKETLSSNVYSNEEIFNTTQLVKAFTENKNDVEERTFNKLTPSINKFNPSTHKSIVDYAEEPGLKTPNLKMKKITRDSEASSALETTSKTSKVENISNVFDEKLRITMQPYLNHKNYKQSTEDTSVNKKSQLDTAKIYHSGLIKTSTTTEIPTNEKELNETETKSNPKTNDLTKSIEKSEVDTMSSSESLNNIMNKNQITTLELTGNGPNVNKTSGGLTAATAQSRVIATIKSNDNTDSFAINPEFPDYFGNADYSLKDDDINILQMKGLSDKQQLNYTIKIPSEIVSTNSIGREQRKNNVALWDVESLLKANKTRITRSTSAMKNTKITNNLISTFSTAVPFSDSFESSFPTLQDLDELKVTKAPEQTEISSEFDFPLNITKSGSAITVVPSFEANTQTKVIMIPRTEEYHSISEYDRKITTYIISPNTIQDTYIGDINLKKRLAELNNLTNFESRNENGDESNDLNNIAQETSVNGGAYNIDNTYNFTSAPQPEENINITEEKYFERDESVKERIDIRNNLNSDLKIISSKNKTNHIEAVPSKTIYNTNVKETTIVKVPTQTQNIYDYQVGSAITDKYSVILSKTRPEETQNEKLYLSSTSNEPQLMQSLQLIDFNDSLKYSKSMSLEGTNNETDSKAQSSLEDINNGFQKTLNFLNESSHNISNAKPGEFDNLTVIQPASIINFTKNINENTIEPTHREYHDENDNVTVRATVENATNIKIADHLTITEVINNIDTEPYVTEKHLIIPIKPIFEETETAILPTITKPEMYGQFGQLTLPVTASSGFLPFQSTYAVDEYNNTKPIITDEMNDSVFSSLKIKNNETDHYFSSTETSNFTNQNYASESKTATADFTRMEHNSAVLRDSDTVLGFTRENMTPSSDTVTLSLEMVETISEKFSEKQQFEYFQSEDCNKSTKNIKLSGPIKDCTFVKKLSSTNSSKGNDPDKESISKVVTVIKIENEKFTGKDNNEVIITMPIKSVTENNSELQSSNPTVSIDLLPLNYSKLSIVKDYTESYDDVTAKNSKMDNESKIDKVLFKSMSEFDNFAKLNPIDKADFQDNFNTNVIGGILSFPEYNFTRERTDLTLPAASPISIQFTDIPSSIGAESETIINISKPSTVSNRQNIDDENELKRTEIPPNSLKTRSEMQDTNITISYIQATDKHHSFKKRNKKIDTEIRIISEAKDFSSSTSDNSVGKTTASYNFETLNFLKHHTAEISNLVVAEFPLNVAAFVGETKIENKEASMNETTSSIQGTNKTTSDYQATDKDNSFKKMNEKMDGKIRTLSDVTFGIINNTVTSRNVTVYHLIEEKTPAYSSKETLRSDDYYRPVEINTLLSTEVFNNSDDDPNNVDNNMEIAKQGSFYATTINEFSSTKQYTSPKNETNLETLSQTPTCVEVTDTSEFNKDIFKDNGVISTNKIASLLTHQLQTDEFDDLTLTEPLSDTTEFHTETQHENNKPSTDRVISMNEIYNVTKDTTNINQNLLPTNVGYSTDNDFYETNSKEPFNTTFEQFKTKKAFETIEFTDNITTKPDIYDNDFKTTDEPRFDSTLTAEILRTERQSPSNGTDFHFTTSSESQIFRTTDTFSSTKIQQDDNTIPSKNKNTLIVIEPYSLEYQNITENTIEKVLRGQNEYITDKFKKSEEILAYYSNSSENEVLKVPTKSLLYTNSYESKPQSPPNKEIITFDAQFDIVAIPLGITTEAIAKNGSSEEREKSSATKNEIFVKETKTEDNHYNLITRTNFKTNSTDLILEDDNEHFENTTTDIRNTFTTISSVNSSYYEDQLRNTKERAEISNIITSNYEKLYNTTEIEIHEVFSNLSLNTGFDATEMHLAPKSAPVTTNFDNRPSVIENCIETTKSPSFDRTQIDEHHSIQFVGESTSPTEILKPFSNATFTERIFIFPKEDTAKTLSFLKSNYGDHLSYAVTESRLDFQKYYEILSETVENMHDDIISKKGVTKNKNIVTMIGKAGDDMTKNEIHRTLSHALHNEFNDAEIRKEEMIPKINVNTDTRLNMTDPHLVVTKELSNETHKVETLKHFRVEDFNLLEYSPEHTTLEKSNTVMDYRDNLETSRFMDMSTSNDSIEINSEKTSSLLNQTYPLSKEYYTDFIATSIEIPKTRNYHLNESKITKKDLETETITTRLDTLNLTSYFHNMPNIIHEHTTLTVDPVLKETQTDVIFNVTEHQSQPNQTHLEICNEMRNSVLPTDHLRSTKSSITNSFNVVTESNASKYFDGKQKPSTTLSNDANSVRDSIKIKESIELITDMLALVETATDSYNHFMDDLTFFDTTNINKTTDARLSGKNQPGLEVQFTMTGDESSEHTETNKVIDTIVLQTEGRQLERSKTSSNNPGHVDYSFFTKNTKIMAKVDEVKPTNVAFHSTASYTKFGADVILTNNITINKNELLNVYEVDATKHENKTVIDENFIIIPTVKDIPETNTTISNSRIMELLGKIRGSFNRYKKLDDIDNLKDSTKHYFTDFTQSSETSPYLNDTKLHDIEPRNIGKVDEIAHITEHEHYLVTDTDLINQVQNITSCNFETARHNPNILEKKDTSHGTEINTTDNNIQHSTHITLPSNDTSLKDQNKSEFQDHTHQISLNMSETANQFDEFNEAIEVTQNLMPNDNFARTETKNSYENIEMTNSVLESPILQNSFVSKLKMFPTLQNETVSQNASTLSDLNEENNSVVSPETIYNSNAAERGRNSGIPEYKPEATQPIPTSTDHSREGQFQNSKNIIEFVTEIESNLITVLPITTSIEFLQKEVFKNDNAKVTAPPKNTEDVPSVNTVLTTKGNVKVISQLKTLEDTEGLKNETEVSFVTDLVDSFNTLAMTNENMITKRNVVDEQTLPYGKKSTMHGQILFHVPPLAFHVTDLKLESVPTYNDNNTPQIIPKLHGKFNVSVKKDTKHVTGSIDHQDTGIKTLKVLNPEKAFENKLYHTKTGQNSTSRSHLETSVFELEKHTENFNGKMTEKTLSSNFMANKKGFVNTNFNGTSKSHTIKHFLMKNDSLLNDTKIMNTIRRDGSEDFRTREKEEHTNSVQYKVSDIIQQENKSLTHITSQISTSPLLPDQDSVTNPYTLHTNLNKTVENTSKLHFTTLSSSTIQVEHSYNGTLTIYNASSLYTKNDETYKINLTRRTEPPKIFENMESEIRNNVNQTVHHRRNSIPGLNKDAFKTVGNKLMTDSTLDHLRVTESNISEVESDLNVLNVNTTMKNIYVGNEFSRLINDNKTKSNKVLVISEPLNNVTVSKISQIENVLELATANLNVPNKMNQQNPADDKNRSETTTISSNNLVLAISVFLNNVNQITIPEKRNLVLVRTNQSVDSFIKTNVQTPGEYENSSKTTTNTSNYLVTSISESLHNASTEKLNNPEQTRRNVLLFNKTKVHNPADEKTGSIETTTNTLQFSESKPFIINDDNSLNRNKKFKSNKKAPNTTGQFLEETTTGRVHTLGLHDITLKTEVKTISSNINNSENLLNTRKAFGNISFLEISTKRNINRHQKTDTLSTVKLSVVHTPASQRKKNKNKNLTRGSKRQNHKPNLVRPVNVKKESNIRNKVTVTSKTAYASDPKIKYGKLSSIQQVHITSTSSFKSTKQIKYNTYKPLTEEELDPSEISKIISSFSKYNTKNVKTKNPQQVKNYHETPFGNKRKYDTKQDVHNKSSIYDPLDKKNLYPVKMLITPRKVLKRIKLANKRNDIMTMNTKDFYSRRFGVTQRDKIGDILKLYPKPVLQLRPVTNKPKSVLLRPKFNSFNALTKKPSIIKPVIVQNLDIDYYRGLKTPQYRRSGPIWKNITGNHEAPLRKGFGDPVIETPYYIPTIMKPKFLRDRVNSIRSYIYNADNKPNYRRHFMNEPNDEDDGYDSQVRYSNGNFRDDEDTDVPLRRFTRPKKTIFFLSPTVPYNHYF